MSNKLKLSCEKDDKNYEKLIRNMDKVKNYEKLKQLFMSKTADINFNRPVTIHIKNDWKKGQQLLSKNDYIGAEIYFINMLLMLCVDFNLLKGLKFLLKNGANPSENLNDGSTTVLTHVLNQSKPNLGMIRALIQNGANIHNEITYLSNENIVRYVPNVLFYAVQKQQCYKKTIFKILIESGVDPSVQDPCQNHSVYIYALRNYIKMIFTKVNKILMVKFRDQDGSLVVFTTICPFNTPELNNFRREKTEALKYLLENSQIPVDPIDQHPQTIYLKNWYKIYMFVDLLNIILRIKQTNVIVEEKITYPQPIDHTLIGSGHDHISDTIYPFSPIGMLINHIPDVDSYLLQRYLLNVLKVMFANGYELSATQQPLTISPLTLLLYRLLNKRLRINDNTTQTTFKFYSSSDELKKEKEKCGLVKLTQFFIDNNAHVNQSIVPFEIPELETFRRDTFLPDAVYAAFESGSFMCFLLVLPYFAQPPLTLLLLAAPYWTELVNAFFPILSEGGPIPPGSKSLKALEAYLEFMNRRQAINHVYEKFLEMHSSPPTLMHLCRCVVRTSNAERASQPGESLPNLMNNLAPPGLRDFLTMPAPERVDVFYCEDPIMAYIANEDVKKYPA